MTNPLPVGVRRRMYDARATGLRQLRRRESLLNRPSYWLHPRLFLHGNKWCALLGTNVQTGIAGFGDTPAQAFADFDRRPLPLPLQLQFQEVRRERLRHFYPVASSPSWFFQLPLHTDGDAYFVCYGEDIADGIAAFGLSPEDVSDTFDLYWFTDVRPLAYLGSVEIVAEDDVADACDSSDTPDPADFWKDPGEESQ